MRKGLIIVAGVIIIIIASVTSIQLVKSTEQLEIPTLEENEEENNFEPASSVWQTSGPFQLDRLEYLLGEKIFIRTDGLRTDEQGQIAFLKQTNDTHYTVYQTVPFNGNNKESFNYYTDIKLIEALGLCTLDDILGKWTVVFRGTDYPSLEFNILNQTLPGDEERFAPVC